MPYLASDRVIAFVADAAYRRLAARRVLLFGSRARQTHQRHSDYDFAVDPGTMPNTANAWPKFLAYLDDAAPTLAKLDVIDLAQPLDPALRDEIERTGILLKREA